MKTKHLALSVLLAAGCATLALSPAFAKKPTQQELQAQATVPEAKAREIALTKAPGGTIKEGELEVEHGKLIWSFDIAVAGKSGITEVQVDAKSGEIVSVENESAKDEEDEAKAEKHEKK